MGLRNDRKFGDPMNIGPRGKTASRRKSSRDPGWTPTEQRKKDQLMRQFIKGFDGPRGNSEAYQRGYDGIRWSNK